MKNKQIALLERFALHHTGQPLSTLQPVKGTGRQAHEILWPLGASFKNRTADIINFSYDHTYEPQADQAIEDYVFLDKAWNDLALPVLTVLYERFCQLGTLFIAHEKEQTPVILPPEIGPEGRTKFLALFWLYGMTLPFQSGEQSLFEHGKLFPAPEGLH